MGGKKKRKTVSLDADMVDALSDDSNASATVNTLLREYYAAGRSTEAALNARMQEKETELERAKREKATVESKIAKLEREIEQLQDRIHSFTEEEQRHINKVVSLVREGNFNGELEPDNGLVNQRANMAGMDVDRFLTEVRDRLGEQ